MRSRVSYEAEQRRAAAERGEALVTFDFDFRPCPEPSGRLTFSGPMPREAAERVLAVCREAWLDRMKSLKEPSDAAR
jgi:hypothetical protein